MLEGAVTPAGEWGYRRYEQYCQTVPAPALEYRKWFTFDVANYTTETERALEKVTEAFEASIEADDGSEEFEVVDILEAL
jgi:hypothetical protein